MIRRLIDLGFYRWRALAALLLIAGFLAFGISKNEAARANGAEIILETQPIDPRDVFFGHYAILSYNIQRGGTQGGGEDYFGLLEPSLRDLVRTRWEARDENVYWRGFEDSVFVVVEQKDVFFRPVAIVGDRASARQIGKPFLESRWRIGRVADCQDGTGADDACWRVTLSPELPRRYYADPETALALQARMEEARRVQREQQAFDNCEEARAGATLTDPPPEHCAEITAPPAPAPDFGIILSVSDAGKAVIKGVYFDGRKIYDSLTGPRITKTDLD